MSSNVSERIPNCKTWGPIVYKAYQGKIGTIYSYFIRYINVHDCFVSIILKTHNVCLWIWINKCQVKEYKYWISMCHYTDDIMTTKASQITSLTVVYSTVYSDADQRKHQSSTSLAFVWGIHRDRWIPRAKGQLRGKCFHLMTASWYV